MKKYATWRLNDVKAQSHAFLSWLTFALPDVLAIQGDKDLSDLWSLELKAHGYTLICPDGPRGTSVALLTRTDLLPGESVVFAEPANKDSIRHLEVNIGGVQIACVNAPDSGVYPSEDFERTVAWLNRTRRRSQSLIDKYRSAVIAGNFGCVRAEIDVSGIEEWREHPVTQVEPRVELAKIIKQGWVDVMHRDSLLESLFTHKCMENTDLRARLNMIFISGNLKRKAFTSDVDWVNSNASLIDAPALLTFKR